MLGQAFAAIRRNYLAFGIYVSIHVPVSLAILLLSKHYLQPGEDGALSSQARILVSAGDILNAIAWAVAQCVAFAHIGREMDRPLWKVNSGMESLKRFFTLWLLLNLGNIFLLRLQMFSGGTLGNLELTNALGILQVMYVLCLLPFGAAVMFNGRVGMSEARRALHTLFNQLPRTLLAMGVIFFSYVYLSSIMVTENLPLVAYPIVDIVDSFVDCFVFACVWYICIRQREEEEDTDFF